MIPVGELTPHPGNVRQDLGDLKDLAASIEQMGVLEPLVAAYDEAQHPPTIVLIAGHRRLAAAMQAGIRRVPVVLRADIRGASIYQAMLIENLHRAELAPLEEARAMQGLVDGGATQEDIAVWIGKSNAYVSRRLLLNHLPEELAGRVTSKEISPSQAIAIARQLDGRKPSEVDRGWASLHFCDSHPLAPAAGERCDTLRHNLRRRVGRVACGECWEALIRIDERSSSTAEAAAS